MVGFLAVIIATFVSDRIKARGPVMLVCCLLAIIGYIILLVPARPAVHYGGYEGKSDAGWEAVANKGAERSL